MVQQAAGCRLNQTEPTGMRMHEEHITAFSPRDSKHIAQMTDSISHLLAIATFLFLSSDKNIDDCPLLSKGCMANRTEAI